MAERKMAKVRKLFKFHKSTTDLSEWNKNDDKLLKAVERGDVAKVENLMNKKTLLPTKPGPKGLSVFHWGALSGQLAIIEVFLSHGVDIDCTDLLGHTALHLAAKYGWPQMVDKLLQLGANKQAHDSDRMAAIHHACGSAHLPCVEVLIRHGASVNVTDKSGRSPMFYCAQGGDVAMCKLLLDHGADPNIQDHLSRTALIFAAGKGHREVVELLLKRGADPEYKDKEGVKAVDYAARGGHNLKEVFDLAPTRASWNVATASSDNNGEDGSKSTLLNDIVRQFSGGDSPVVGGKLTPIKSKEVHSSGSSNHSSPHSGDTTLQTSSTKEQTTQEAYKELEEEHELLTEELRVLRINHIKLKDKVEFLTERSQNKDNGKGEDSQRIKIMEVELNKSKELYSIEQEKTKDLELKLDRLEQKLHSESQVESPGISDNWGDSDEELFGNNNNKEKIKKGCNENDSQHIALLRSQILTLQQENHHLKERLQSDSGPNSPKVERLEKERALTSEGIELEIRNGADFNGLKKEKLDLIHEIETLKEQATSLRQSPLTHSVSVFSEGESGIHMNGERSPSPRDDRDNAHPDENALQEECATLRETTKKMQVAYSALVEAGDKLQLEFDELYNEKSVIDTQLQEVIQDKEDLLRENDFLSADNLHEDLERLINELETLQERNKDLEAEKEELERRLKNFPERDLDHSGTNFNSAQVSEEHDLLKARCQELEDNSMQLKHDHAIVIEEIQSVQEQCHELQIERDQIQQELELVQDDLDKVTQQYDLIQQEYGQLEQDYAELLADKGKLEQDFMEMETSRARDSPGLSISQHNQDILLQQHSILTQEKDLLESKVVELQSANQNLETEIQTLRTFPTSNGQQSDNNDNSIKISSVPSSSEKDKQIRSLQIKISRLQQNLTEIERKHRDTVNTYRTHLVSAVQGHMDPEVKQAIHHIIEIRGSEEFC